MDSPFVIGLIVALVIFLLIWINDVRSMPSRVSNAAIDGDLADLKSMLVKCSEGEKHEALFSAIMHRRDEALDVILESKPNLTRPLEWGGAALHIAARYGTPHALDRLLTLDVDIEQDCLGTPLYWAADAGRDEVVNRLIECGADADAVDLQKLGKSGFKPNFNTPQDYDRISNRILSARNRV